MQLSDTISVQRRGDIDVIKVDNQFAKASISLFGGHLLSFIPKSDERDRLWVSEMAIFDGRSPIRGGIPICWPWFSNRFPTPEQNLPSHGYVRNQLWSLIKHEDSSLGTRLIFAPSFTSNKGFEFSVALTLMVTVAETLTIELITENTDKQTLSFTGALHTYFAVSDISQVLLEGLSGTYHDKTRDWQEFHTPSPYRFAEETDRVHHATPETLLICDDSYEIIVGSKGHDSIVVWNPWQENSRAMNDMPDKGYASMLCVETAITDGLVLNPGESHYLTQTIK